MPPTARPDDPYRRRREAGTASRDDTRRRLLSAADSHFRKHGYRATTVTAIAAGAGVSLQTLYLAWGSKAALFKAAAEAAAAAAPVAPGGPDAWQAATVAELAEDAGPTPGTSDYLAAISRIVVRVVLRTARYRELYQEAAATDTEIAAAWRDVATASRETMLAVAATIPSEGLRPGLSTSAVADTLWALASPEMYDLMTGRGGYSGASFEAWLRQTLIHSLCPDDDKSPRPVGPAHQSA